MSFKKIKNSLTRFISKAWIRALLNRPQLLQFYIPWVTLLKNGHSSIKDGNPWITFEAWKWLQSFLTCNMTVFEYGSGGSTIFIAKRVKKLISVEHDHDWYQTVSKNLKERKISNCEYLLREPTFVSHNNKRSLTYTSCVPKYANMSFKSYVKSIDIFPDESLDLVIVDGRARSYCMLHSLSKLRSGGFLMLDNSDTYNYKMCEDLLIDWEQTNFFGPGLYASRFWQTTIWKKP